jgi:hypothetical protein
VAPRGRRPAPSPALAFDQAPLAPRRTPRLLAPRPDTPDPDTLPLPVTTRRPLPAPEGGHYVGPVGAPVPDLAELLASAPAVRGYERAQADTATAMAELGDRFDGRKG